MKKKAIDAAAKLRVYTDTILTNGDCSVILAAYSWYDILVSPILRSCEAHLVETGYIYIYIYIHEVVAVEIYGA